MDECQKCQVICLETVAHCLSLGGKHASLEHIGTLLECAEACRTSVAVMALGSPRHGRFCAVCAEACRACEESCRSMGDDPMMKACAEACRRCAESCEQMARGG